MNFPLESLNLYIQNMVKVAPSQVDLFALNKMDFGLRKLFEHNMDETELAFLKDLAVFQPSKYFVLFCYVLFTCMTRMLLYDWIGSTKYRFPNKNSFFLIILR